MMKNLIISVCLLSTILCMCIRVIESYSALELEETAKIEFDAFVDEDQDSTTPPVPVALSVNEDDEKLTKILLPGRFPPDPDFQRPTTPAGDIDSDDLVSSTTVDPLDPDFDIRRDSNAHIRTIDNDTEVFAGRLSCQCGKPGSGRVVGGELARISNFPWTAALVKTRGSSKGKAFCGGTLINNFYIVTASHCVDGMSANSLSVVLNQEDFSRPTANQVYYVSRIIMHPNYNRRIVDNDIALIKLSQPVRLEYAGIITPACLPAGGNHDFAGIYAQVTGWGATTSGGTSSDHLRVVEVPILSNRDCNSDGTKYRGKITNNMLCAGNINFGGIDACQGDSGGPLVISNGDRKTLVGVVSWGYGCGEPRAPGVYARVGNYPEWILQNTRDADWCD